MASGFALGGFAQGLSGAPSQISNILTQKRQLGQQDRQLGQRDRQQDFEEQQAEQQAEQELQQRGLDQAVGALDAFTNTISQASQNVSPERAIEFINSAEFQKGVSGAIRAKIRAEEALGLRPPGGDLGKEAQAFMGSLIRTAQSQPTAAETGDAAAETALAKAESLAKATGVPVNQALGFTPETALKVQKLVVAIQAAEPGSFEHTSLMQALKKELSISAGVRLTTITNPDGSTTTTVSLGGEEGQAGAPGVPKAPTAKLKNDQIQALQQLQTGAEMIDALIAQVKENPAMFGVTGSFLKGGQTLFGALGDAASILPLGKNAAGVVRTVSEFGSDLKDLIESVVEDPDLAARLVPRTFGELDVMESVLKFGIARSLQGPGKLLAASINAAEGLINLRGVTSSGQVLAKLEGLKPRFASSIVDQERLIQLTAQGQTTEESISAINPRQSVGLAAPQATPTTAPASASPAGASPTIPIPTQARSAAEIEELTIDEMSDEEIQIFLRLR